MKKHLTTCLILLAYSNIMIGGSLNTDADTCEEATTTFMLETAPDGFDYAYLECSIGCLEGATPDSNLNGLCGYDTIPTVWYKLEIDGDATQLIVNVTTDGGWTPQFSIFEGSCDDLRPISTDNTAECSSEWFYGSQISQPIDLMAQTEYWIVVGGMQLDLSPISTNFEICLLATKPQMMCQGNEACEPKAEFTIVGRSNDPDGNIGLPLNGPYCQGETVSICSEYLYDTSNTGADWLHGLIPVLGSGWDQSLFTPDTTNVLADGNSGWWHGDSIPILQEPLPHMCAYVTNQGRFQLCNALCSPCKECETGMNPGDPMPGGWFWLTPACDEYNSPSNSYGLTASVAANIEFCVDLTVRSYESEEDYNANSDLSFGFQVFTDGVTGCWEDPVAECIFDQSQVFQLPSFAYTDVVMDSDNDGYCDAIDCDPENASIYPGLACDDADSCTGPDVYNQDCICAGVPIPLNVFYADVDGDGFGTPNVSIEDCTQLVPEGYTDNNLDCDDTNPNINPDAEDIPNNGIDEDCDGEDFLSSTHDLNGNEIDIYPNPVRDILQVKSTLGIAAELQLFNTSGQMISQSSASSIDCSNVTEGMYILKVIDMESGDFVVERVVVVK